MSRRALVVAFVAALVVLSAPASAGNVIASEHDTFGTGNQGEPAPAALENATVQGSGASASVDFDPVPAESYNVVDDTGDGTVDDNLALGDNGASNRLSQEIVLEPTYSGEIDSLTLDVDSVTGSDYGFSVDVYLIQEQPDGDLREGTQLGTIDPDFTTGEQQFDLSTSATVDSSSEYSLELVVDSTDSDFQQDSIEIGTDSSANSEHIRLINSGGSDASLDEFADVSISQDPSQSGRYVGATHQASDVVEGEVELSNVTNTDVKITWEEDADGDGTFSDVASQTVSSSGTYSNSLTSQSSSRWRADIEITRTGSSPTAEIEREAVITNNEAPNASNPQPTGDLDSYGGSVELDVSDPDFSTAQGDRVTVNASQNGTQIGSTTIAANGTVGFNYNAEAGQQTINWTVTDSEGLSDTASGTFTAPNTLRIENASDPGTKISGASNEVTVRFFDSNETVITRTTTTGEVSLSGLPAAPPGGYVITVDSDGDYQSRTVVISSLFDDERVLLLPTNASTSEIDFKLDDRTGEFGQPVIALERPLTDDFDNDGSSETRYTRAAGDRVDASDSALFTLENSVRYRLRVSQAGQTRVLGSFTPTRAEVVTLTIGQLQFGVSNESTYSVDATTRTNANGTVDAAVFNYSDPTNQTTQINVTVATQGGVVIARSQSATQPIRSFSFVGNVSPSVARNSTLLVRFNATRGGEVISGQFRPGTNRYPVGVPLDDGLKSLFAVGSLLLVGGLFSARNAAVGAVVTPVFAAGLWFVEWLPSGVTIFAIAVALAIGVVANYGRRR